MPEASKTIIVMGTMDTKGPELAYLAQQISSAGCRALLMDVGAAAESDTDADITACWRMSVLPPAVLLARLKP